MVEAAVDGDPADDRRGAVHHRVVRAGGRGARAADSLAARLGLGGAFEWAWKVLQWPIVFSLVAIACGLIYYFAPDVDQDWVFLTPGSVVATLLWLIGSLGFRFYVVNFGSYNETYGAIGGVMVLLLWLYISGLCVIAGAEMNAEIEHASEHGKAAGEKRPGERRVIGARAAREFREKQQRHAPNPGARPPVVVVPSHSPGKAYARSGVLAGGILASLFGRRVKR
jgi:membrane protein